MELTYEITRKGYKILRDGTLWILQEDYIPYNAETIEESAQLHINAILREQNIPKVIDTEEEIRQLKELIAGLYEIVLFGGDE